MSEWLISFPSFWSQRPLLLRHRQRWLWCRPFGKSVGPKAWSCPYREVLWWHVERGNLGSSYGQRRLMGWWPRNRLWKRISKMDPFQNDFPKNPHENTGTYLVVWNFLEDFVICWLIEQAHILELVPGFSFRPLLFGLLSTSGGGFRLGVLGLLWCLCHF